MSQAVTDDVMYRLLIIAFLLSAATAEAGYVYYQDGAGIELQSDSGAGVGYYSNGNSYAYNEIGQILTIPEFVAAYASEFQSGTNSGDWLSWISYADDTGYTGPIESTPPAVPEPEAGDEGGDGLADEGDGGGEVPYEPGPYEVDPVSDLALAALITAGATALVGILGVLVAVGIGFIVIALVGRKFGRWVSR